MYLKYNLVFYIFLLFGHKFQSRNELSVQNAATNVDNRVVYCNVGTSFLRRSIQHGDTLTLCETHFNTCVLPVLEQLIQQSQIRKTFRCRVSSDRTVLTKLHNSASWIPRTFTRKPRQSTPPDTRDSPPPEPATIEDLILVEGMRVRVTNDGNAEAVVTKDEYDDDRALPGGPWVQVTYVDKEKRSSVTPVQTKHLQLHETEMWRLKATKQFLQNKKTQMKGKPYIFEENKFHYDDLPEGTHHWVMWYKKKPDESTINKDIEDALKEELNLSDDYDFVWYENPRMSMPQLYHLQVFWKGTTLR